MNTKTILIVAGAALALGGIYYFFLMPKPKATVTVAVPASAAPSATSTSSLINTASSLANTVANNV